MCAKVKYELEGEKRSKLFFQQIEKRKDSQETVFSEKLRKWEATLKSN